MKHRAVIIQLNGTAVTLRVRVWIETAALFPYRAVHLVTLRVRVWIETLL